MAFVKGKLLRTKVRRKDPLTLESFSVSGDVGGSRSFTLNSGFRNVQDIFVVLPGGQRLDLDVARYFLTNSNLRLRIRVSDARNPDNPSFKAVTVESTTRAGEMPSRILLRNDFSDIAFLRLTVAIVSKGSATVRSSDGWALRFSIKKL